MVCLLPSCELLVLPVQPSVHLDGGWWKYVIWMTNWGIWLFCGALLLETVITVTVFLERKLPPRILLFSWAWTTMAYAMAVFITLMYWTLLYHGDVPQSYSSIFKHGLQVPVAGVVMW